MANEITGQAALAIASGPRRAFLGVNFGFTLTSEEYILADQSIGTVAEALSFGDVTPALVAIINQDATNYVDIGLDSGATTKVFARVKAGGVAIWMPYTPADPIYAKANSSACKCAVLGVEGAALGTMSYQSSPFISGAYTATAYLQLAGASTYRGVSLTATHAWTAAGADPSDSQVPFGMSEIAGADITLTAACSNTTAGGYLLDVNAGDSEDPDGYLSLVNDASDKVCKILKSGGFCLLPLKASGVLYCGGADSVHVPLYVTT